MKKLLIALIASGLSLTYVFGQDGYHEVKDSIKSAVLNQTRNVSIYLPDGYDEPTARFPVIYVLDADGRCQHTVPTARFLFLNGKMPRAIIVGVYNLDRNHDFLPVASKEGPTGGGADNFLSFFKKELIPFVNNKYKTENFNVLIGHSYGGLFAMHCLLTDPDVFNAYIAIDPSFWYAGKIMVSRAGEEFKKTKNWNKSIFITGRAGNGMDDMGINSMDSLLKLEAPPKLDWKLVAYENEDHGSVTFKSTYDGLRFLFETGDNFAVYPHGGIIPAGYFSYALIENNNSNLHYTMDGTEPDLNSPLCSDTIRIHNACTLKVKAISKKYGNRKSIERIFKEEPFWDAPKEPKKIKKGLKFSYYEGVWDSLPDFSKLKPVKTGKTDSLSLDIALKRDSFAIQFDGYLKITQKGLYNLWVVSDDGAKVYLNNKLILNNDGLHDAQRPYIYLLPLNPGYYPLKIEYFEKTGGEVLMPGYLIGTQRPEVFGKDSFYYKD
ncbi:MAG: alpha/beta hydrolase-fold protein [Bacteroidales bacterium]